MDTKELMTIMQLEQGATIVACRYNDAAPAPIPPGMNREAEEFYGSMPSNYHFKNVIGVNLEEGDMVVVETMGSFKLATVVDPQVLVTDAAVPLAQLAHVVAKVKNDAYIAAKEGEAEAHRKLSMAEVTKRLNTYKDQIGIEAFDTAKAALVGTTEEAEVVAD